MRKSAVGKLLAIIFILGCGVILLSPNEVLAKKKVKTEKVTIIKGRNECMTFRKLKIKKIKIKYSKKNIAKVRLKKDASLGPFIQIDGKKVGQTTITVKAYVSKKKYKTLKYNVKVTDYTQIARSQTARKKAKKAFTLQNKYRKQAGVKAIEWSDELYEFGLYRLKTSGYDRHKHMWRDSIAYFGEFAFVMESEYIKKDVVCWSENLATHDDLIDAVNAWKGSPGHYRNMTQGYWKCGAIIQYKGNDIAIFSALTASEMDTWRNYKNQYAKLVIKRQDSATGKFIVGSHLYVYDKADKQNSLKTYQISKEDGVVIYVKAGQNFGIFEPYAPNGLQKAQRVEITAIPISEGVNEVILK